MRVEHLEAQTQARPSGMQRLRSHLHWGVAALALILWGLHFAGVLFPGNPHLDEVQEGLAERRQRLEERVSSLHVNAREEMAGVEAAAQEIQRAWSSLEGSVRPGRDLAYSPAILELLGSGGKNEIVFNSPRDVQAEALMGAIRVRWLEDTENNVGTSGWEVLRSTGPADFQRVAVLPADTTSYVDKDVRAGVSYAYRVVALSEDPVLPQDARRTPESPPVRLEAVADVKVSLEEADLAAKTAVIKVEKWHEGSWWSKSFQVGIGDPVGEPDTGSGVDFSTGLKLKSLDARDLQETRTARAVVFDPQGLVVIQNDLPLTEEVTITEDFREVTVVLEGGPLRSRTLQKREKS